MKRQNATMYQVAIQLRSSRIAPTRRAWCTSGRSSELAPVCRLHAGAWLRPRSPCWRGDTLRAHPAQWRCHYGFAAPCHARLSLGRAGTKSSEGSLAAHPDDAAVLVPARPSLRWAAGPEHPQHPVRDQEAADDVDRAEDDSHDGQEQREAVAHRADDDHRSEQHDAVDGVGGRHQWCVERVGHARYDVEADERGEEEDRDAGDQAHRRPSRAEAPSTSSSPPSTSARARSLTISPSRATQAPAITSSSKSRWRRPSSTISPTRACTLRA